MSDPLELANTLFPPPPAYYKSFTDSNLARYAQLNRTDTDSGGSGEPSGTSKVRAGPGPSSGSGAGQGSTSDDAADADSGRGNASTSMSMVGEGAGALSEEEKGELGDLQGKLGKPRADWVVEEGRWMCFGQQYDVEPRIPTHGDIGLPRWIDPDDPPQTSLPPLLHSFLHTLLRLIDALTNTARIPGELEERGWQHEGDQYIQHLSNLAATMMVSSNQLRDVQAEATLVLLMEKQLATRKAQTEELRSKSELIRSQLAELRGKAGAASAGSST